MQPQMPARLMCDGMCAPDLGLGLSGDTEIGCVVDVGSFRRDRDIGMFARRVWRRRFQRWVYGFSARAASGHVCGSDEDGPMRDDAFESP